MKFSPTDLDPTIMTIAKACVGALVTIALALGSWLVLRIVGWVRWWMTQEQKFARLAAFEVEVMGDPTSGKIGLRARVIAAEDAAAKASKDTAALYSMLGLTPGAMQAVQTVALRDAIRRHVFGVGAGAIEPPADNGDVFSGVRERFANVEDTGRGRARVVGVTPSPLPPPASPRTRSPAIAQVVNHPVWDSRWGGKGPPDSDDSNGSGTGV